MKVPRVLVALLVPVLAVAVTGCSLVGKRRVRMDDETTEWQVLVLNGRGFEKTETVYMLALYDGNMPVKQTVSLLQL